MKPPGREPLRLLRILGVVAARGGERGDLSRISVEALEVGGAGVMVMVDGLPTPLCASNPLATRLEDLQNALGEGPGVDAHRDGLAVAEPDLARPRVARWVAFGPAALAAGAGAVFSFPARVGGVRLGALTLYQTAPGRLSDDQHADAMVLAGVIADAILVMQTRAPPGTLSPRLEVLADRGAHLHQASGMVSVQLGVSVGEALVRLRAHAYAAERSLSEVAADVVGRRLLIEG